MRVSSVLAVAAGVSTASAAPTQAAAAAQSWEWAVTEWSAGYFKIAGVGDSTSKPATPSFKAYCNGAGEGADYSACTILEEAETPYAVVAKLLPRAPATNESTSNPPVIQVSLQFTDLETPTTWWNYTGKAEARYNQFVAPAMNFTITPDTIHGVA
ncbi:hypothetical protein GGS23DRAFT_599784 [Durotheca rogersii]|uniref:uncharacterized protein n=1 Tax=Durotheca rogersii TaxID=419775 RepID=UPI00221F7185|nr:uncharacterized protein GGS23DRAFT_599784 [Durotheca rogersii]KAI5860135.1 hypothetical protein GGS23DRAFT_599784 [Durotheca rogersii]